MSRDRGRLPRRLGSSDCSSQSVGIRKIVSAWLVIGDAFMACAALMSQSSIPVGISQVGVESDAEASTGDADACASVCDASAAA